MALGAAEVVVVVVVTGFEVVVVTGLDVVVDAGVDVVDEARLVVVEDATLDEEEPPPLPGKLGDLGLGTARIMR